MPQLATQAVADWLTAYEPSVAAGWLHLIRPMEDTGESPAVLADLGRALDDALTADALGRVSADPESDDDLYAVLTQLGAARLLRILRWLGRESGEGGAAMLMALFDAKRDRDGLLRAALQALHRQALLARIFDESRLEQLLAASKTAAGEAA